MYKTIEKGSFVFWNRKQDDELYVRCDEQNLRSAYRVDADDQLMVVLMVGGERVQLVNLSANGVAFRMSDSVDEASSSDVALSGVLFVGDRHNPIPVRLEIVVRREGLVRCKISHQDLLAQKKLAAAINRYQKLKIRAAEQSLKDQ